MNHRKSIYLTRLTTKTFGSMAERLRPNVPGQARNPLRNLIRRAKRAYNEKPWDKR
jgi:hypothetical protein